MIGKETRAKIITAIIASSLIITNAKVVHDNNMLNKEVQDNSATIQTIQEDADSKSQQLDQTQQSLKDEQQKNSDLQSYIDKNKQVMEQADAIRQQNDDLSQENNALKLYRAKTQSAVLPSRGGPVTLDNANQKKLKVTKINVELSMYCRTDEGGERTATGERTQWGMIAVPPEIALGSEMVIPGFDHTVFKATDHGGYIKKVGDVYRIDIFTENRADAMAFGRKHNMVAYVIEKED